MKEEPMQQPTPFRHLGARLKYVREQKSETLAEAAGAVEIDVDALDRIESGHERPAEDVLLLLMDHFDIKDQDAMQIWESAGYAGGVEPRDVRSRVADQLDKPSTIVVVAMDMRTQYSDGVDISANRAGITLQFTQGSYSAAAQPVSRIGMSYEQAEELLASLQRVVLRGRSGYTQRRLGEPKKPSDK
jgi:DNA-binding XRE family transcriptional regulator